MKKVAWILACGALIAACGGGGGRADSGPDTGGGIVLMDTGPVMMRDAGRDTGGPMPGTCGSIATAMSVWPPLPNTCLPRCSSATLSAVQSCPMGDDMCFDNALLADRTPAAQLDVGMGMTVSVDCGGNGMNFPCLTWQQYSCIADSCPDQFAGFVECATMAPMGSDVQMVCATQIMALNTCIEMNMTAFQTCAQSRLVGCFDTGGGFLPSGAARFAVPNVDLSALTPAQLSALAAARAN
ncbi:MAG: hypothetical protein OHK0013_45230 [Sandaracinaceae bacterium]